MTVDYDAPRRKADDPEPDALADLPVKASPAGTADTDDGELVDPVDLPGADLSGEEFSVRVVPKQADEFTCSSCFLVHHHNRLANPDGGAPLCSDCA